ITSATGTSFIVGLPNAYTITTLGFPAASFSESGDLPSGLTFDTTTGVLSGRPAAGTHGIYNLVFTANNGIGGDFTQNFTLTVGLPPVIISAADTWFTKDSSSSFTVTALGYPTPTFSTPSFLPWGLSFDTTTGVLSGSPAWFYDGNYGIYFTASNGVGAS